MQMEMFKKRLTPQQKADAKVQKIRAKVQKKQAKLQAKTERKNKLEEIKNIGKPKKEAKPKKHITSLSIVGSKMLSSISGFTAVTAFYEYFSLHSDLYAGIFAGATFIIAGIASAPYIRNAGKLNKTLGEVVSAMDGVDKMAGSQQALVSAIASEVEKVLQQKGFAPEIQKLQAQIDDLKRKSNAQPQPNVNANVHTPEKKNVKVG